MRKVQSFDGQSSQTSELMGMVVGPFNTEFFVDGSRELNLVFGFQCLVVIFLDLMLYTLNVIVLFKTPTKTTTPHSLLLPKIRNHFPHTLSRKDRGKNIIIFYM